jgi:hypothetical protein
MADENNQIHIPNAEEGYDRREARAGLVAIVTGATMLLLLIFVVGIYWFYQVYSEAIDQQQYSGVSSKELIAIREREDAHLYKYAPLDKTKGTYRIPIDRAIDLVAGEFAQGKVFYNTATYAAKPEPVGGASAPALASAAAPAGAAAPVVPNTNAQTPSAK